MKTFGLPTRVSDPYASQRAVLAVGVAARQVLACGASLASAMQSFQRQTIRAALEETKGNQSAAARLLGVDRGTLSRKIAALFGGRPAPPTWRKGPQRARVETSIAEVRA